MYICKLFLFIKQLSQIFMIFGGFVFLWCSIIWRSTGSNYPICHGSDEVMDVCKIPIANKNFDALFSKKKNEVFISFCCWYE